MSLTYAASIKSKLVTQQ
jgi:hypothetical protein